MIELIHGCTGSLIDAVSKQRYDQDRRDEMDFLKGEVKEIGCSSSR